MLNDLRTRLRALFRRKKVEAELDEELRFHVEQQAGKYVQSGMTAEEAARRARIELGGMEQTKEECREARGVSFIETIIRDMRYGLRQLRRNPGFAVVAVLTLSLGIGANTAIFSVVDAALLHPLPYPNSGRIVEIYRTTLGRRQFNQTFSYRFFKEVQGSLPAIEGMAAYRAWTSTITGPGEPEEAACVVSSANMFTLLGVHPVLGRPFSSAEDQHGAPLVALISETVWRTRFGGKPNVLGKTIDISGEPYSIVGVFRSSLRFPGLAGPADVWTPLVSDPQIKSLASTQMNPETVSYLSVLGRLKRGAKIGEARAQADTLVARLSAQESQNQGRMGLRVALFQNEVTKGYSTALDVLLGAVGLVLLIACANVANLMLARATTSERETALRLAMGAGRATIARQMLVESVELGLAGGVFGVALAYFAVKILGHWVPASLSQLQGASVNGEVLGFAAAISVVAGILFGSLPAWHVSDLNVSMAIKEGGRGSGGGRGRKLRQALVVVEVALAVTLLAGAGLLLRSFSALITTNPGFDPRGVAVASVTLPRSEYRTGDQWRSFVSNALTHLQAAPGVSQFAAAVTVPGTGLTISDNYGVAGQPTPPPGQSPVADIRPVTPGYFALMRIPLLAGRDFAATDSATNAPVCAIDQALERASFANQNPLGHSLTADNKNLCRIVAVVGNTALALGLAPKAAIYMPVAQSPFGFASFLARGPQGTAALMPLLQDSIHSVDRHLVVNTSTLERTLGSEVDPERFRTALVGVFAGLAILLAAVGISGVLGYSVTRRTQEIGVRMALGATPGDVVGQVAREGLILVSIGAVVGLGIALWLTRWMRSLLFHVSPADPITYIGVALSLLVIALGACALPAIRASRVDPAVALRHE
jgi:predicted permease